jgi:hypothetical protein
MLLPLRPIHLCIWQSPDHEMTRKWIGALLRWSWRWERSARRETRPAAMPGAADRLVVRPSWWQRANIACRRPWFGSLAIRVPLPSRQFRAGAHLRLGFRSPGAGKGTEGGAECSRRARHGHPPKAGKPSRAAPTTATPPAHACTLARRWERKGGPARATPHAPSRQPRAGDVVECPMIELILYSTPLRALTGLNCRAFSSSPARRRLAFRFGYLIPPGTGTLLRSLPWAGDLPLLPRERSKSYVFLTSVERGGQEHAACVA